MENKQEFNYPSLTRQCYSQDENSRLKAINVPLPDFLGLKKPRPRPSSLLWGKIFTLPFLWWPLDGQSLHLTLLFFKKHLKFTT